MLVVEVLVVHSVEDEVEKIENDSFAAFFLNYAYDIVVRSRMILDQYFSYYTDLRLLYVAQRQFVKIHAYAFAVALELVPVAVPAVLHCDLVPLLIERVGAALFNFVRTC